MFGGNPERNQKNIILAVVVVLVVLLILNSEVCSKGLRKMLGMGCGCGCGGASKCGNNTEKASCGNAALKEAFSTRPYNYNKDTAGRGVSWQTDQLDKDHVMSHEDYIRSVGIDKSTVANHKEWYQDPNLKPYYGSNFNLRSDYEQTYLVPPHGLRRRPTAVPIGASARQVPDIDEREFAQDNQLGSLGNFTG